MFGHTQRMRARIASSRFEESAGSHALGESCAEAMRVMKGSGMFLGGGTVIIVPAHELNFGLGGVVRNSMCVMHLAWCGFWRRARRRMSMRGMWPLWPCGLFSLVP